MASYFAVIIPYTGGGICGDFFVIQANLESSRRLKQQVWHPVLKLDELTVFLSSHCIIMIMIHIFLNCPPDI